MHLGDSSILRIQNSSQSFGLESTHLLGSSVSILVEKSGELLLQGNVCALWWCAYFFVPLFPLIWLMRIFVLQVTAATGCRVEVTDKGTLVSVHADTRVDLSSSSLFIRDGGKFELNGRYVGNMDPPSALLLKLLVAVS